MLIYLTSPITLLLMPKKSGFTLVELLIVVTIIVILSTIAVSIFSGIQKNTRDSKRKADVNALSKALEIGYKPLQAQYPASLEQSWFALGIPKDPLTNNDYDLQFSPGNRSFKICANLEDGTEFCKVSQQGGEFIASIPTPTPGAATPTPIGGAGGPTPPPWGYTHPMTVINRAELLVIRQRIAEGIEPQFSAYLDLIEDADSSLGFTPDPPDNMHIMGAYEPDSNLPQMRAWLWRNAHAAYASALAYAYSGQEQYAQKGIEVLNAWADKNTTFTGGDRGLQLGSYFSPMLYAADLLYDYPGWDNEDKEKFKNWWTENCLIHTWEVMMYTENNWKDAGVLGVLAAAVVLEDKELLQEGLKELESYFEVKEEHTRRGAWKIKKDEHGVYLPHEVTRSGGKLGITYTGYALTTMVQALEIARYAGQDSWHDSTEEGATLKEVIEWYFRWDILEEPFFWNDDPDRYTTRKNPYELVNNNFSGVMPEIKNWLEVKRPVNGQQGDEYITLNKGNMPVE